MPENDPRSITPYGGGLFQGLAERIKLILRLMADPRVNPLIKLLPITSVVYLLFPDILPGPIDDAALIWLSAYLFVEICPPDIVQEHMDALRKTSEILNNPVVRDLDNESARPTDIIEGEFREDQ